MSADRPFFALPGAVAIEAARREAGGSTLAKYGNKRTEYNGRWYASKLEAKVAHELDMLQRAGLVVEWKAQVRISLEVPAPDPARRAAGDDGTPKRVAIYVADFWIRHADGREEIIETKGAWTDYAKMKRRIFEATWLRANPSVIYRVRTK